MSHDRECQCFLCQGFPDSFTAEEVHAVAAGMMQEPFVGVGGPSEVSKEEFSNAQ